MAVSTQTMNKPSVAPMVVMACSDVGACDRPSMRSPSARPPALAGGARTVRPVPQIPRVLHTRSAGAGACRHHALLERGEAAVPGLATAAGIHRAPWAVDLRDARTHVDQG